MDRNSLLRWIVYAAIAVGGYYFLVGRKSGPQTQDFPTQRFVDAPGFAPDVIDAVPGHPLPAPPPPGTTCTIAGKRFSAEASSRGAGLTHFFLTDARYAGTQAGDMSTTPDIERWRNLRTTFRANRASRLRPTSK